jgi:hypothetical protein
MRFRGFAERFATLLFVMLAAGCGRAGYGLNQGPSVDGGPGGADGGDRDAATDAPIDDGSSPTDAETGTEGGALTDSGVPCEPSDPARCEGDTRVYCDDQRMLRRESCPLGCEGGACTLFVPSNLSDSGPWESGTADLVVGDDAFSVWVFDTDTGSVTAYDGLPSGETDARTIRSEGTGSDPSGIAFAPDGPTGAEYGVFAVANLRIRSGGVVVGVGSRPWVLVVADELRVEGVLSGAADELQGAGHPGPGAGTAPAEGSDGFRAAGGAGGSFGSAGGIGANSPSHGGGTPGATYGTAELVPLVGGMPGGPDGRDVAAGGRAGGAVQLAAGRRIVVGATGRIDVSGGGGEGGQPVAVDASGGGGGGSGGGLLLEAPVIINDGAIGANGGAGGQGSSATATGSPGARGRADRVPAAGTANSEGRGGGGSGSDFRGASGGGLRGGESGGGGGGGAGRIRFNTAAGTESFVGVTPTLGSGLSTVGQVAQ